MRENDEPLLRLLRTTEVILKEPDDREVYLPYLEALEALPRQDFDLFLLGHSWRTGGPQFVPEDRELALEQFFWFIDHSNSRAVIESLISNRRR